MASTRAPCCGFSERSSGFLPPRSPILLSALAALADGWSRDPRATEALAVAAKSTDPDIAAAERAPDRTAKKWCKRSAHETLEVSCIPWTTALGDGKYLLLLKERSQATAIPAVWRGLLTNRQQQVVADVRKGWDNRLIAAELGCAEGTVKKHLQSVFNRLGLASRAALIARANALDTERETDS